MKVLKSQIAVCTSVQVLGSVAHAVYFHEAIEDTNNHHKKPQWAFIIPGMKVGFEIGKSYTIQICDQTLPNGPEG